MPWLGEWGLAIEQHHESFNGSGYPFGLSGDEISLGARIVAVADAFEVMTAIRSYKKALSPVAARQELTRCAGSQFDPAIVRALLNASIGRVRWVIGPVSWVADVPLLARLSVAGHALVTTTQVAVGAAALTAAGALAVHAAAPTVHTPVPTSGLALAAPTVHTPVPTSGLALAAPTTTALAPRPAPPVTAVQTVASTASLRIASPRPTTMTTSTSRATAPTTPALKTWATTPTTTTVTTAKHTTATTVGTQTTPSSAARDTEVATAASTSVPLNLVCI